MKTTTASHKAFSVLIRELPVEDFLGLEDELQQGSTILKDLIHETADPTRVELLRLAESNMQKALQLQKI